MKKVYIGVDIGGTKIAFGIFGEDFSLLSKHRFAFDNQKTPEYLMDKLAAEILQALESQGFGRENLLGIGIGAPGTPDMKEGKFLVCANASTLNGYPIGPHLEKALGAPAIIDNDANIAAICEHELGAGQGFEHMIYSTASTGIGGGLIFNGKIFRGSYNCAGEIGHTICTYKTGRKIAYSNPGSVEGYAGGGNICAEIMEKIAAGEPTLMKELSDGGKVTGQIIKQAYEQGDAMATWALDQIGEYLGLLYFNLYQILNVNCYVIGGGLTNFGEELFSRIEKTFYSFYFQCPKEYPVYFKQAKFSQDAGIYGAALLFTQQ